MSEREAELIRQDKRARRIETLMADLEIDPVLADLRQQLLETMLRTDGADDAARARLHAAARAIETVRGHIRQAIADGKFARRALRELRDGRRRFF